MASKFSFLLSLGLLLFHLHPRTLPAQTPSLELAARTPLPDTMFAEDGGEDTPSGANIEEEKDEDEEDDSLDFLEQDISEIRNTKVAPSALAEVVTSVSRSAQPIGRTPAAIYVITSEKIRRSGARSIPEALRMVPGLQVARITANTWAITIRGFNGQYNNKLLVQIDGRSIYTPLFSGVDWDAHGVLLEDVDRIEVIRGPGATVWGANAVNGIISITTKSAKDTLGAYAHAGGGTEQRLFGAARMGGQDGHGLYYRVYGKQYENDDAFVPTGPQFDQWQAGQAGMRIDWEPDSCNTITFQGDYISQLAGKRQLVTSPVIDPGTGGYFRVADEAARNTNANMLLRWTHVLDDESDWSVQMYYDHFNRTRDRSFVWDTNQDVLDLDIQYRFPVGADHDVVCGFGYRDTAVATRFDPLALTVVPPGQNFDIISYFVQDTVTLSDDRLFATLGIKCEHNDFTDFEYQPTAKLVWTPSERRSLWGSVSRAVRTPSVFERSVIAPLAEVGGPPSPFPQPTFLTAYGNPDMDSEELIAYEIGMRSQPVDSFSWDLALFYNDYERLQTMTFAGFAPGPVSYLNQLFTNNARGETYGLELAAVWNVAPSWRLHGSYSFLVMDVDVFEPNSSFMVIQPGSHPRNMVYAQSGWDLGCHTTFDLMLRYVDSLEGLSVPSYLEMDARLACALTDTLEVSLVGRNVLDNHHPEYDGGTAGTSEVQSEVFGMVTWRR